MFLGKNSSRSQPSKLHKRPEVQTYLVSAKPNVWIKIPHNDRSEIDSYTSDDSLEVLVLISSFEADQVHAPFPAVVPGVEPVPLGVGGGGVPPRQPVVATVVVVAALAVQSCK